MITIIIIHDDDDNNDNDLPIGLAYISFPHPDVASVALAGTLQIRSEDIDQTCHLSDGGRNGIHHQRVIWWKNTPRICQHAGFTSHGN